MRGEKMKINHLKNKMMGSFDPFIPKGTFFFFHEPTVNLK